MRREKAKKERWVCICKPYLTPTHGSPEECAFFLEGELRRSLVDITSLRGRFGMDSGHSDGESCVCGGPLFKWTDPTDKTRICPYCAARYIQYLKGLRE